MALTLFVSCASQKDLVVVGCTLYEPMNYYDASGELIGFDTELARAVFDKLGMNVTFKVIDWKQKYMELDAGTVNCLWNGFTANTNDDDGVARSEKIDFSYNYMVNKQVIVTSKEIAATVTDAASLKGKVGGVETGSAGETYFTSTFPTAVKKGFTSQLDAFRDLALGALDFVVLDEQLAKAYVGKGDYKNLVTVDSLASAPEYYAIGLKKGSDLREKINGALDELAKDGTIGKLAEKYGLTNTVITDFSDQK